MSSFSCKKCHEYTYLGNVCDLGRDNCTAGAMTISVSVRVIIRVLITWCSTVSSKSFPVEHSVVSIFVYRSAYQNQVQSLHVEFNSPCLHPKSDTGTLRHSHHKAVLGKENWDQQLQDDSAIYLHLFKSKCNPLKRKQVKQLWQQKETMANKGFNLWFNRRMKDAPRVSGVCFSWCFHLL